MKGVLSTQLEHVPGLHPAVILIQTDLEPRIKGDNHKQQQQMNQFSEVFMLWLLQDMATSPFAHHGMGAGVPGFPKVLLVELATKLTAS